MKYVRLALIVVFALLLIFAAISLIPTKASEVCDNGMEAWVVFSAFDPLKDKFITNWYRLEFDNSISWEGLTYICFPKGKFGYWKIARPKMNEDGSWTIISKPSKEVTKYPANPINSGS